MTGWNDSDRRDRLPSNWGATRLRIFARDGWRCVEKRTDGSRCWDRDRTETGKGLHCDHINAGSSGVVPDEELQTLCSWHHGRKSSREGLAARSYEKADRKEEEHPLMKLLGNK